MQIFGIDLWRILLCIFLIILVVKRANIVAFFARRKYAAKDFEKALKIFRVANIIGNMSVANKALYCYTMLRCGMVDEAQLQLRGILPYTKQRSAQRYEIKNLIALTYWKQGSLDEAIEEMEEMAEEGYKNTQVYQNLGIFYNLAGDREKAIRFNREAYEYNKDDNIICDNLADAYAKNGDYEKAAEIYEEFINRTPEPHFPEAYYGYGMVLSELGQKERGIELIEKSLTKPFSYLSIKTKAEVEQMLAELK